jgi:glycerol-3-phosphate dehydrogenase (NAD(P)+)
MYKKITTIGCGSWGTALANIFAENGLNSTIWGRDESAVQNIQQKHLNPKYLKNIPLNPKLKATSNIEEAFRNSDCIVCSIPTQNIRSVFSPYKKLWEGKPILNSSKGIEIKTHYKVNEIFKEMSSSTPFLVLSGPSFAEEVALKLPTLVTVASEDKDLTAEFQKLVTNSYFRAYTSTDVVGIELAGALKNVVAIASGLVAGLKLGFNAQAAIINRGMVEIARLGNIMNAKMETFLGLSGMGDLILTCTGPLSRNRKLGVGLGEGKKLSEVVQIIGGVAEGMYTAQSGFELSVQHKIEMPITEQVYQIIYKGLKPEQAMKNLMSRDLTEEWS